MWLKLQDSSYVQVETGTQFTVTTEAIVLYRPNTATPSVVVQKGYTKREDAQAALDELMDNADLDYLQAQPPVQSEELQD